MSETAANTAQRVAEKTSSGASGVRLEAEVHGSWAQLANRFDEACENQIPGDTLFQRGNWIQAWYDTVGAQAGTEPVPLEIRDADTGCPLFGVPLVKVERDSQQFVEFADAGLTDYNAPLTGPVQRNATQVSPGDLLKLLQRELKGCDQLNLRKMPARLGLCANPFAQLPGAAKSTLGTNLVCIEDSWADYRKRLAKKVRKELERSFRVFQRDGTNARFEVIRDPAEAIEVLEQMELSQAERMRELNLPFILNEPQYAAFYRRLIELDLSDGRLLLTVLRSEPDELVGALLGLVDGDSYAMVRLAHAGKAWSHCSPGKLMIDQTMQHLHSEGVTRFDFTTGDYNYKKGFLTESEPLIDVSLGLSLAGRISQARSSFAVAVKEQARLFPRLYALAKRFGSL